MRVGGDEILWARMQTREIAASAAGDQDLLAKAVRVFQKQNAAAPLAGFDGTHQSRRAGSEDNCVVFVILTGSTHAISSLAGPALPRCEREGAACLIRRIHGHEECARNQPSRCEEER
jgi:hypothetical protein